MWFPSRPDTVTSASPPGKTPPARRRCPRPAKRKPFLERLEDRSLLSGGVTPSLVALGGATPLPLALPLALAASPFGGPDIYQNFQGPADQPPIFGNDPNQLTNFDGFYAGARVQGTGTDNQGNTLLWDADLRVMQGTYQGLDGNLYAGTFAEV
jgi:hypothetical protein